MKVSVMGPNLRDQSKGTFHVHKAGCFDLARDRNYHDTDPPITFDADSRVDVCDTVYDPGDFQCESGEFLFDFHFAPCVDALR